MEGATAKLCEKMEAAGKAGDTTALAELMSGFDKEITAVGGYLDGL